MAYIREVSILVEVEGLKDESDDGHQGLHQAELQRRLQQQQQPHITRQYLARILVFSSLLATVTLTLITTTMHYRTVPG